MKNMVICPNCHRVINRSQLISVSHKIVDETGFLDKIKDFLFTKENNICCNNCYNDIKKKI